MKKGFIIVVAVLGGLAVLGGAIIGLVFWFTGGAVEASEEFLALIAKERIEEAYQSTAAGFRSQQDAATFAVTVKEIGLTRYQSASWTNRQIQNDRATLEGSVTTVDGGTIPLTIALVSEGDEWRVLSLTTPMAGAAIAGADKGTAPVAPDDNVVRQLVNETMRSFSQALQRNDFDPFYETISDRWKRQITREGLSLAFQPLIEQKTNFANIQSLDPTFGAPPAIDQDGLLVATGVYPTEPDQARFKLSYIYEAPTWKLFGIHVVPERSDAAAATPPSGVPGGAVEGGTTAPAAVADAGAPYIVAENPDLTGRLGRVIVAFPEGTSPSSTKIEVRPAGGKDSSASNYGGITADLLPGAYDVVISGVLVPGAEVRSRHDTKIAVGVLRVSAGSSTKIQVFRGQQAVASGYGNTQFGLPAGTYELEISGQREPITITAGGIIDF
ncbi:MAG: hypothetical protein LC804_03075 [Acidobacteria bacterium]|nr:hypothetical protein [Acidobacteriota bacterium]